MSVMGFFLLWLTNILTSLLGKDYFSGEFVIDFINAIDTVYNIFAWLKVFLPMDFFFALVGLTALYYSYRFVLGIVRYVVSLFK